MNCAVSYNIPYIPMNVYREFNPKVVLENVSRQQQTCLKAEMNIYVEYYAVLCFVYISRV